MPTFRLSDEQVDRLNGWARNDPNFRSTFPYAPSNGLGFGDYLRGIESAVFGPPSVTFTDGVRTVLDNELHFNWTSFYLTLDTFGNPVVNFKHPDVDSTSVTFTDGVVTLAGDEFHVNRASFYLTPSSSGKPVLNFKNPDLSSIMFTDGVNTFTKSKLSVNRTSFYLTPDSIGNPVLNFKDAVLRPTIVTFTDGVSLFRTDQLHFDRNYFYLTPSSQGYPVVNWKGAFPTVANNPIPDTTAFGEAAIAQSTPVIQINAVRGLGRRTQTHLDNGGGVTPSNGEYKVSITSTLGSNALIESRNPMPYRPGQGGLIRLTARANTPVAGSYQAWGALSETDGWGFGYNGTSFGILFRRGGAQDVRTVTVTNASGTSVNVTLTMNGVAYVIPVTAVTAARNAWQICAWMNANQTYWKASVTGAVVTLIDIHDAEPHVGAFTIAAASGTFTGSIATVTAGVAPTDTWTPMANWNILPGGWAGFNPQLGNVYQIRFQWLGYGSITFFIEDPAVGGFVPVHQIQYANTSTIAMGTSVRDPNCRVRWQVKSITSTTAMDLYGPCGSAFVEGAITTVEPPRSITASVAAVSTSYVLMVALQSSVVLSGIPNNVRTYLKLWSAGSASAKGTQLILLRNPTQTGTLPTWTAIDASNSGLSTSTDGVWDYTTGQEVMSITLGASGGDHIDLKDYGIEINPGDVLVVAAKLLAAPAAEVGTNLIFQEET